MLILKVSKQTLFPFVVLCWEGGGGVGNEGTRGKSLRYDYIINTYIFV